MAEDLGVVQMVRGLEADVADHSPHREAVHVLEVGAAKLRRAAPPEGGEQPRCERLDLWLGADTSQLELARRRLAV